MFGPAAWMPERIENTFDFKGKPVEGASAEIGETFLAERESQISFLERIGLRRASPTIPGLVEQLRTGTGQAQHLVLNLLPAQPEYALGGALCRLAMEDLSVGLEAVSNGARQTWIVMDRSDFRTRRLWSRALKIWKRSEKGKREKRVRFRLLLNRYPQGEPTILMRTLFRKKLPVGAMPTTQGVLIVDPVSCWAVGRWLRTGQTFTDRPVQLFAEEAEAPRLVLGRIGETVTEFCQRHQVSLEGKQVILNGMLAGREIQPEAARIDDQTEAIIVRTRAAVEAPSPCLSCGWCVDVCPTGLQPIHLLQLAQRGAKSASLNAGREARHCIECGLCSYVCPTRLPLMREAVRLKQWAALATREPT